MIILTVDIEFPHRASVLMRRVGDSDVSSVVSHPD